MENFQIYFEIFEKKMKMSIEANSKEEAKEIVKEKLKEKLLNEIVFFDSVKTDNSFAKKPIDKKQYHGSDQVFDNLMNMFGMGEKK
jgi:type IV secretory pathway VirD2 relaxase